MNQILGYTVDDNGLIVNPGKFEREPAYMPLAYEAYMDGRANETASGKLVVNFPEDMKARFPQWKHRKQVRFVIDDNGFVTEC